MRVTPEQISTIVQTARHVAGENTHVWLFGSRLDDARKGGDIDLLIESTPLASTLDRARIKNYLEQHLQLPVDVLTTCPGAKERPFIALARAQAIRLS